MASSGNGRVHRRVDRSALPDPAAWTHDDRSHRRLVRRIVWFGAGAVALLSVSAWSASRLSGRAASARAQAESMLAAAVPHPGGGALPSAAAPERTLPPEELARLQRSWEGSRSYAPRDDRVDADTGERLGAFQGFGVQVDGAEGARVLADGEELGTAPLLASVACRPGEPVEIRVERGAERAVYRTRCRADALLKLAPRLAAR
jgi:hypothetical protein